MPPSADLIKKWSKFSPFLRNSKNVWNAEQIKARLRWHFVYITWSQLPPPPLPVEQQPGYSRSSVLGGVPAQSKPSSKHSSLTQLSNALRKKSFVRISRQYKLLSRYLNKSSQFSYNGVRGKYCLILIILRKWHLVSPTLLTLTLFLG